MLDPVQPLEYETGLFRSAGFWEEGKTGVPEENLSEQRKNQQQI